MCIKINKEIGFRWWKKYVAAGIWSNVATPTNLIITLITALTTGQVAMQVEGKTKVFLSEEANYKLSVTALILSTLNYVF